MKRAAYLVATYKRPLLLRGCLEHLASTHIPEGWSLEIIVAAQEGDPGIAVAEAFAELSEVPIRLAIGKRKAVGAQFQRALYASQGADLILETGDDALQSAERLRYAVEAFEAGALISGSGGFWFYDWKTERAAFWRGNPLRAGVVLNFAGDLLRAVGGWDPVPKNNDSTLQKKIEAHLGEPPSATVLPEDLELDTVAIHTPESISSARPFDGLREFDHGSFRIKTVGAADRALDFPLAALETLQAMRSSGEAARIVMVCHNRLDLTKRTLESYVDTVKIPHRLILVNNGSNDGHTDATLRSFAQAAKKSLPFHVEVITRNNEDRLAGALDFAWREYDPYALEAIVGVVGNDAIFQDGWLEAMLDTMLHNQRIVALASRIREGERIIPDVYAPSEIIGAEALGSPAILIRSRAIAGRKWPKENPREALFAFIAGLRDVGRLAYLRDVITEHIGAGRSVNV